MTSFALRRSLAASVLVVRGHASIRCFLLVVLLLLATLPPTVAAHHGWSGYDTTKPLFFTGALQQVSWQNPHTEVQLSLSDTVALPTNLAELPIPQEFEAWGGREVLRTTRVLTPSEQAWTLVLAPLTRMQAWGVTEAPNVGETMSGVGYLSRTVPGELRIELVILSDGQAVWLREAPQAGSAGAPVVTLEFPPAEQSITTVATAAASTAAPATAITATPAPTNTATAQPVAASPTAPAVAAGSSTAPAGGVAPENTASPAAQADATNGWLWGIGLLVLLGGVAVLVWRWRRGTS